MESDTAGSIWNFDGAEFFAIFELKAKFVNQMKDWDLEGAYWTLRTLRMELDAMLPIGFKKIIALTEEDKERQKRKQGKESEKAEVDRLLKELEEERKTYLTSDFSFPENKSRFFLVLEAFYMRLCSIMKKHKMYFREGEDSTYAILRR